MASFETLRRYQEEWNGYVKAHDSAKLAEAMRFVLSEFNKTEWRTTAASWMELPASTLQEVAQVYPDRPQEKSAQAAFLATKTREQKRLRQQEIQQRLEALETGNVEEDTISLMITALDTYIW
jgi:hypothetical protein